MWTVFKTRTPFDINALTTFGLSAKPYSTSPIGQFGTGLKYSIAILARLGIPTIIYSDNTKYEFFKEAKNFRGSDVDMIMMRQTRLDGEKFWKNRDKPTDTIDVKLPFTSHLGGHWELWQAFRELESNTRDENGTTFITKDEPSYHRLETQICVFDENFANLAHARGSVFIEPGRKVLFENDNVQIADGNSDVIYYRGVRVLTLPKKSIFTYNLKREMQLTEDRTLANEYAARVFIMQCIRHCTDQDLIQKVITSKEEEWYEGTLDFDVTSGFSEQFASLMLALIRDDSYVMSRIKASHQRYLASISMERPVSYSLTASDWKAIREDLARVENPSKATMSLLGRIDSPHGEDVIF